MSKTAVCLSIFSSALFALLVWYTHILSPLNGSEIFAWRIITSVPGILILFILLKKTDQLVLAYHKLINQPQLFLYLIVSAILLSSQLWLFVWAPVHQYTLDLAMGYFLLPISVLLVGKFVLHEKIYPLQYLAIFFTILGVIHELWSTQAFSWVSLLVMFGYPPYFLLRRKINLFPLTSFFLEMLFALPFAMLYLQLNSQTGNWAMPAGNSWLLLSGLALISCVALGGYLASSQMLPMGIFGVLGLAEPVFIFLVAVLIFHEPLEFNKFYTYVPFFLAVILIIWHSINMIKRNSGNRKLTKTCQKPG